MKTPLPQGLEYGPETPGYARLNAIADRKPGTKQPRKKRESKNPSSQGEQQKPKTP